MKLIIKYAILLISAKLFIMWLTKPAFAVGLFDQTVAERNVASVPSSNKLVEPTPAKIIIKHSVKAEIGIDVSTLDLTSAEYVELNALMNQGRLRLNCVLSFYDAVGSLQVHPQAWGYAFALNSNMISVDFEEWSREAGVRMVYFQHRIESNKCLLKTEESI